MMWMTTWRSTMYGLALLAGLLVPLAGGSGPARGSDSVEPPLVVGRFAVVSEAGGAVWTFRPGGELVVAGPGDLQSLGNWSRGPFGGEFDASVDSQATGQTLTILGAVSADGRHVALYVRAAGDVLAGAWRPWPSESRLLGERVDLAAEVEPAPSLAPLECLRPAWVADAVVDWDRCADGEAPPSPEDSPPTP